VEWKGLNVSIISLSLFRKVRVADVDERALLFISLIVILYEYGNKSLEPSFITTRGQQAHAKQISYGPYPHFHSVNT